MKKILFFVESLRCGGAERSLLSLLSNLDPCKYDITLLMLTLGGEFEKFIPEYVDVKYFERQVSLVDRIKYKVKRTFNFANLHHAQVLWKVIGANISTFNNNAKEYDVAIAWGQGFATYFTASKINANRKYAWVNIDFKLAGYVESIDKPIYDKFDGVVGVSEFVQKSMQRFLQKDKVHFIKNIIDIDDVIEKSKSVQSHAFDKSKFNIVSVGRLAKQKAFNLAIESAHHLKKSGYNFHWYILGEGEERESLEFLIKKLNLADHVTLLGFIENPYPYIRNANVYCQTSLFEGLGRVLIEASHLNKVTISTDFPSAYSLIEPDVTGCIVPMRSELIAEKIMRIIDDKDYFKMLEGNLIKQDLNTKAETLKSFHDLIRAKNEN